MTSWLRTLPGFCALTLCLLGAGALRSWYATELDGVQPDEHWHAVAGASYVQRADFRLNPEHPPLVKLWVGAALGDFALPPFRELDGKGDERELVDDSFYLDNDWQQARRRMRLAMLLFNGLLMFALALSLRALVGPLALAACALLELDPTVCAHMPVVLTDLPLALTGALAVTLALLAFQRWRPLELALAALALGAALATKHSALPLVPFVALLGVALAPRRWPAVLAVLLGAYVVLWGSYAFRFDEAPVAALHTFNRALEDKIADVRAPEHRALLTLLSDYTLLPRAYLWGLADIVRAGVEGRQFMTSVFGRPFYGLTPWYFFPAALLVKLPLALLASIALGAWLLARDAVPRAWRLTSWVLGLWAASYLLVLMRGNSGYAGVRHALPVYPALALFAAMPLVLARAHTPLAILLCISVLPLRRPWEFYNALAGGTQDAWRYFSDDGLENGLRSRELAAYYDANVRDRDEPSYDFYGVYGNEQRVFDLHWRALEDDPLDADTLRGTVFVSARELSERPYYDLAAFRAATPVARFGNLLVYRGTFRIPWLPSRRRRNLKDVALGEGQRQRAEDLLRDIVRDEPRDYESAFDLGNLLLERGAHGPALEAYSLAREHAPQSALWAQLDRQIAALRAQPGAVAPLVSPWDE